MSFEPVVKEAAGRGAEGREIKNWADFIGPFECGGIWAEHTLAQSRCTCLYANGSGFASSRVERAFGRIAMARAGARFQPSATSFASRLHKSIRVKRIESPFCCLLPILVHVSRPPRHNKKSIEEKIDCILHERRQVFYHDGNRYSVFYDRRNTLQYPDSTIKFKKNTLKTGHDEAKWNMITQIERFGIYRGKNWLHPLLKVQSFLSRWK